MTSTLCRRQHEAPVTHRPRSLSRSGRFIGWFCVGFALLILRVQAAPEPFLIQVIEKGSGWPVPLVEFRTTHQARFLSDNNGRIAFDLPELMGTETWFEVVGHGYQIPPDGFGYRGVRLTPKRGGKTTVEVTRTILARRLGRITGAGLFAEGEKAGIPAPLPETGVLGCDTVQTVVHGNRLFWLWGDTTLARYPLGIFHSIAAFTGLRPLDRPEPPLQLRWQHVAGSDGKPRAVADLPGSGPTWITACASLPDRTGQRRLVASYMKIKPPLEAYEWGLCIWDETAQRFGVTTL